MSGRACPFCASSDTRPWGERPEGTFLRCATCGSCLKALDPETYNQIHASAFEDGVFIERAVGQSGPARPDFRTWDRFFGHLPPGRLLEIGPGTGHLLAAARDRGWAVESVEASSSHRAWIMSTWGMRAHAALDEMPSSYHPDLIVMINVLEHVLEPSALLATLAARLAPGGHLFISLPNARSTTAALAGVWWSMFKPSDHVSIPSLRGLNALACRSGWRVARAWSGELALETPLGLAVAAQDRWRALRAQASPRAPAPQHPLPESANTSGYRSRLLRLLRIVPPACEPTALLACCIGRGATLKAWLTRPSPESSARGPVAL